jgi:FSR family fosmidomycin resistance protein-like MFS transporter
VQIDVGQQRRDHRPLRGASRGWLPHIRFDHAGFQPVADQAQHALVAGGGLADRTRRHGEVAAIGFGLTAALVLVVGAVSLGPVLLALVMGAAGFLSGMIMPSRDMLVRGASPPGAEGRVFGIVTTGFNLGGIVSPIMFGALMDHHLPAWVFYVSVALMLATAVMALLGERRPAAQLAGE